MQSSIARAAAESKTVPTETSSDLAEVLESETHVDMNRMLQLALLGVPDQLRAEAWKYMLRVLRPERSEEISLRKRMEYEHKEIEKAWRARPNGELSRAVKAEIAPHRKALGQSCGRLERILTLYAHRANSCGWDARPHPHPHPQRHPRPRPRPRYVHTQGEELRPGVVHMLRPFVQIYAADAEAYYCFQELMKRLEWSLTFDGCKQMTVAFMTLLRHTLPELYSFLEEEQSCGGDWLASWLQVREPSLP